MNPPKKYFFATSKFNTFFKTISKIESSSKLSWISAFVLYAVYVFRGYIRWNYKQFSKGSKECLKYYPTEKVKRNFCKFFDIFITKSKKNTNSTSETTWFQLWKARILNFNALHQVETLDNCGILRKFP